MAEVCEGKIQQHQLLEPYGRYGEISAGALLHAHPQVPLTHFAMSHAALTMEINGRARKARRCQVQRGKPAPGKQRQPEEEGAAATSSPEPSVRRPKVVARRHLAKERPHLASKPEEHEVLPQQQPTKSSVRTSKARALQAAEGAVTRARPRKATGSGVRDALMAIADPLARPLAARRPCHAVPHLLQGKASRPVTDLKSLRPSMQTAELGRKQPSLQAPAAEQESNAALAGVEAESAAGQQDSPAASWGVPAEEEQEQASGQAAAQPSAQEELPLEEPAGPERLHKLRRMLLQRFCRVTDTPPDSVAGELHAKVEELVQRLSEGGGAAQAAKAATEAPSNSAGVRQSSPGPQDELWLEGLAVSDDFAAAPSEGEGDAVEGVSEELAACEDFANVLDEEFLLEDEPWQADVDNAGEADAEQSSMSLGELSGWEDSSPEKPLLALRMRTMPDGGSTPWESEGSSCADSLPDFSSGISLPKSNMQRDEQDGMALSSPQLSDGSLSSLPGEGCDMLLRQAGLDASFHVSPGHEAPLQVPGFIM